MSSGEGLLIEDSPSDARSEKERSVDFRSGAKSPGDHFNDPTATYNRDGVESRRPLDHTLPTRQFGDYLIQREIGRGGMGVVYKAVHQRLNRVVALKCLRFGELANPREIQRFQAESQAAARLDHPNIVPVFEVGQHAGLHYYAMGFVDGEPLSSKLQNGPWKPRDSALLVQVLAQAVAFAHQRGVIHRDLKPGNVMIDSSGQPRITDFGLAKITPDDVNITISGDIIGTPRYISPELAEGRAHEITTAVDTYGLGAILYCLLTASPPFLGSTIQATLYSVSNDEPVSPRRLNPSIPQDLETICLKCLEKSPAKRYATAANLAEDLQRFLEGNAILARSISPAAHVWRWCRRNRLVATLAALTVFIGAIGSIVSATYAVRASLNAREASTNLEYAQRLNQQLIDEKNRTNRLFYQRQIQQAYWEWKLGNVTRMRELLADCDKTYRGWEHRFLSELPRRGHQTWTDHTGPVICSAISPDGTLLVSGSRDRTLKIWDVATGTVLHSLEGHQKDVTCVAFSQDGHWLLSGSEDKTIRVWNMHTYLSRRIVRQFPEGMTSVGFTPDGKQVVVAGKDGSIRVFRFSSFEVLRTLKPAGAVVHAIVMSPSEPLVAAACFDATVRIWNVETGEEKAVLTGHIGHVNCVAFDPLGKRLVSGSRNGAIKVWEISTGTELRTFSGHEGAVLATSFSHDGTQVVSAGWDRIIHEWDIESSVRVRTLRGHTRLICCLSASDALNRIVSGSEDGTLMSWDPYTDQETCPGIGHTNWVHLATFDPTSALVATASVDHTVRLWDATTGQSKWTCSDQFAHIEAISFANDRKFLFVVTGEGILHVVDMATGVRTISRGEIHPCSAAAIGSSEKFYVTGGADRLVRLWDLKDGQQLAELSGHESEMEALAISPDDNWIASANRDRTIRIWDVTRRKEHRILRGFTKRPRSVAFDATGKRLVAGGDDMMIRVWDVPTGELLFEKTGHTGYVRSAEFSPDCQRIVSAGLDTLVKIWDAQTGDEILTLRAHLEAALCAEFSPDGQRLASGGTTNTLRVWDAAPATTAP